jgi:hypothetical protein
MPNLRKSCFNPNRGSYLTKDAKFYCYDVWNDEIKQFITYRLEIGTDISPELAAMLDASDHELDLQDRYDADNRDAQFAAKVKTFDDDENGINPWDLIADHHAAPEETLCAEKEETENPQAAIVRRVIEEDLSPAQRDLFFAHFGEGRTLEELRQEEAARTGRLPSAAAMTNRKNKIVSRAAKALGVEPIKRHKYPKKD